MAPSPLDEDSTSLKLTDEDYEIVTDSMVDIPSDSRDYTHLRRSGWTPSSSRVDMTQTVRYLSGVGVTEDGTSEVEFELSDQITTFKVTVNAYSKLGLYGLAE